MNRYWRSKSAWTDVPSWDLNISFLVSLTAQSSSRLKDKGTRVGVFFVMVVFHFSDQMFFPIKSKKYFEIFNRRQIDIKFGYLIQFLCFWRFSGVYKFHCGWNIPSEYFALLIIFWMVHTFQNSTCLQLKKGGSPTMWKKWHLHRILHSPMKNATVKFTLRSRPIVQCSETAKYPRAISQ